MTPHPTAWHHRAAAVIIIATLVLVAVLAVAGCGATSDSTTSGQRVDRSPAEVIAMPDGFKNVAHKCDGHGHRVYSNSGSVAIIDDSTCRGTR